MQEAGSLTCSNSNEYDRGAIGDLDEAPDVEAARLFRNAGQRRHLSGDELVLARTAREEIKQRASRVSDLIEKVEGLSLAGDQLGALRVPGWPWSRSRSGWPPIADRTSPMTLACRPSSASAASSMAAVGAQVPRVGRSSKAWSDHQHHQSHWCASRPR